MNNATVVVMPWLFDHIRVFFYTNDYIFSAVYMIQTPTDLPNLF